MRYDDKNAVLVNMLEVCYGENITSFADAFIFASDNNYDDWLEILCSFEGAYVASKFFESLKLKQDSENK